MIFFYSSGIRICIRTCAGSEHIQHPDRTRTNSDGISGPPLRGFIGILFQWTAGTALHARIHVNLSGIPTQLNEMFKIKQKLKSKIKWNKKNTKSWTNTCILFSIWNFLLNLRLFLLRTGAQPARNFRHHIYLPKKEGAELQLDLLGNRNTCLRNL